MIERLVGRLRSKEWVPRWYVGVDANGKEISRTENVIGPGEIADMVAHFEHSGGMGVRWDNQKREVSWYQRRSHGISR